MKTCASFGQGQEDALDGRRFTHRPITARAMASFSPDLTWNPPNSSPPRTRQDRPARFCDDRPVQSTAVPRCPTAASTRRGIPQAARMKRSPSLCACCCTTLHCTTTPDRCGFGGALQTGPAVDPPDRLPSICILSFWRPFSRVVVLLMTFRSAPLARTLLACCDGSGVMIIGIGIWAELPSKPTPPGPCRTTQNL